MFRKGSEIEVHKALPEEREVQKALRECCSDTRKKGLKVESEIDTTTAEAEFMSYIPMCQIVPMQIKARIESDENSIE